MHKKGQWEKIHLLRFLSLKSPLLCFFFTDFDINAHEGPALDGESESVLILKNSFCTVGQKSIFLDF